MESLKLYQQFSTIKEEKKEDKEEKEKKEILDSHSRSTILNW